MTSAETKWRIGMDTGGTFTDLIALNARGQVRVAKVSSTPSRPSEAVFEAVRRVRLSLDEDVESFVLGTTIATNAVIMRRGARVLLLTTSGFEDVLEIQRIDRPPRYDLQWVKTPAFAARQDVLGVAERVDSMGGVRLPLTDDEIKRVVSAVANAFEDDPSVAVAISFLFSYVNPSHEQQVAAALRSTVPSLPLSVSSEVAPVWREYERGSTTVMDAYVTPIVAAFADDLQKAAGTRLPVRTGLMKSNGGQVPLDHAHRRPIELVLSGLAGGMIAGAHWATVAGSSRAVTLDMGGTSADVGVIFDGELQFSGLFEPEWGIPVTVPAIDVTTIGAGGSSIASIDAGGFLQVGPASAGADPGPACYNRGGQLPTITDANVVLGRLDPAYFLGGSLPLAPDLAARAVATVGDQLDLPLAASAEAIVAVAVENMASAVRLVTVDRGYDYREFDLVAFGGAGPLHAVAIARTLGMARVIIPPTPGLVSAYGALIADERIDRRITHVSRLSASTAKDLELVVQSVLERTAEELESQANGSTSRMQLSAYVSCRYVGQNYEQEIRTYTGHLDKSFELALAVDVNKPFTDQLTQLFHAAHEKAYGYSMADQPVETVFVGATATIPFARVVPEPYTYAKSTPAVRLVSHDRLGFLATRIVARESLNPGDELTGPAIITESNSTSVIPPGYTCFVDASHCLIITRSAGGEAK